MVDWNNAAEVAHAISAGKLPPGWRREGTVVVCPDTVSEPRGFRGHTSIMAMLDELRTESGVVIKSRDGR